MIRAAARSANRGRASASPQIWRPSPIFALRYACRGSIDIGTKVPHLYKKEITFASLRSACPSLDRRIGTALRLRLRYGGRRRSSHLGLHVHYLLRSHSVRSNKKVI